MKFEELTELYFMSIKASSANGTYYNKKNAIYTHVIPYFKGMNIDAIRPYDIEKCVPKYNEIRKGDETSIIKIK